LHSTLHVPPVPARPAGQTSHALDWLFGCLPATHCEHRPVVPAKPSGHGKHDPRAALGRRRCTPCSSHHQVSACPRRTCRNHQAWHWTESQVSTPRKRSEPARCCSRRCGGVCHSRRGCSGLHRLRTSPHWAHHHGRSRCTHVHLTRSHPEDTPHSSCSPAVLCLPDIRCTQCRSSRPSLVID
jgi:hypothetical protein